MSKPIFDLVIPENELKEDFTIIYKGLESKEESKNKICEIKTSKDEFLRKLRYFKTKTNEILLMDEIYIHEDIPCEIFRDFINSIISKHLPITENNYSAFYELSAKYQYHELQSQIKSFIDKRPDISLIIDDLSAQPQEEINSNYNETDKLKEEILSKNLDFCLQNGLLSKLPIQTLNRILNSPTRVLKNHRLLFEFVISQMKDKDINEDENLQILPSCLDFDEMSTDEISELISKEAIFTPRNSNKLVKTLIMENKEKQERNEKLQQSVEELSNMLGELKSEFENQKKNFTDNQKVVSERIQEQQKSIQLLEQKNKEYEASFGKLNERIRQLEMENEKQQTKVEEIEKNQEKEIMLISELNNRKVFYYTPNEEFNGIINYLRRKGDILNEINITSSSIDDGRKPQNVVLFEDKNKYFCSESTPESWLCFEFKNNSIIPTGYTFRKQHEHCYPKGWIVEGSNDNDHWDKIDEQGESPFTDDLDCCTFNIKDQISQKFKYVRIKSTKLDSNGYNYLIIESFEFFGTLVG